MSFFTGSIPLLMLSTSIYSNAFGRTWRVTDVRIDPSSYTKQNGTTAITNAWFECQIEDPSPGPVQGPGYIDLYDEAGILCATITTDGIKGEGMKRYRVAATLDLTQIKSYRLVTRDTGNFDIFVNSAFVILDVEDAFRVKLPVAYLVAGDASTSSGGNEATEALDNANVWCLANSDLTYTAGSTDYTGQNHWVGKFLKDESKFATIESWELEVAASQYLFVGNGGTGHGYAAIFNATTNTMVTGSEITFDPGDYGIRRSVTFANDAVNFTDLDEFEPRFKVENNTETLAIARANVYVQLTAATKAQYIAGRILNGSNIPFSNPQINSETGRYYHDASKFPVDALFYYELTGQLNTSAGPVAVINDAGTNDFGYDSTTGTPSTATVISGSWTNPQNAGDDGAAGGPLASIAALFESAVSGAVGQIRLSGYSFSPAIPSGVTITQVNNLVHYELEGQTATIESQINSGGFHSNTGSLWDGSNISHLFYDMTADASWAVGDFTSVTTSDVKFTHPANAINTKFWLNGAQMFVGWSDQVLNSELTFTTTARVRQRTVPLTLIDGHRYTALHPGSNVSTLKILHSNGVILAEVVVSGGSSEGSGIPADIAECECDAHPGRIYRMSMDLYSDDGCTIRRLRRTPHISEEQVRIIHRLLQLDAQAGQGLDTGQGSDPQVMLRFSDDGGITWSNQRTESAGKRGEFKKRVIFRNLGQSRDRLYELVVTDPVKWAFVSGYLEIEAGRR